MSRSRTPQKLRALAADLSERYPGCRASAEHSSGKKWDLTWRDGPALNRVRALVDKAVPAADVTLSRSYSPRAVALAGIRACLAGQVDYYADGSYMAWQDVESLAAIADTAPTTAARLVARHA